MGNMNHDGLGAQKGGALQSAHNVAEHFRPVRASAALQAAEKGRVRLIAHQTDLVGDSPNPPHGGAILTAAQLLILLQTAQVHVVGVKAGVFDQAKRLFVAEPIAQGTVGGGQKHRKPSCSK